MDYSILRLAEFVHDTTFSDLPVHVVDFTKKHLLDTFGCGIAGVTSDKGKWGIDFGRRCFGNRPEAVVLGYGDRLSMMGAAFVNAELINGLDYEAAGLHLPPFVIPPVLALAEVNRQSGRDLITAAALSLEVGTRIAKGLIQKENMNSGEKPVGISPVFGPCSAVFGGAAGAAKMLGFDKEKTAHAMGLSGVLSPVPSQASMHRDLPVNSGKYLMAGWAAQTGLTSAELIKSGHRGNLQVLDSEFGYWRFTGQEGWDSRNALDGLGENWEFLQTTPYKQFPCCGMMHGGLECLAALVEESELRSEEIESIHAYLDPSSEEAMFNNRDVKNQIDAQFSVAYNMSLVAMGIKPGIRWQDGSTIHDPKIRRFMDKVTSSVHPECAAAQEKDRRARVVSVEVKARGRVFAKELRFIKGTVTAGSVMEISDEERITKFRENTSLILPEYRAEAAIDAVLHLEQKEDMRQVMELMHV